MPSFHVDSVRKCVMFHFPLPDAFSRDLRTLFWVVVNDKEVIDFRETRALVETKCFGSGKDIRQLSKARPKVSE